jgi:hypothetical protein
MSRERMAVLMLAAVTYAILGVAAFCAALLSCLALLSQAVRTAPGQTWKNNFNALVIGASYVILVSLFSLYTADLTAIQVCGFADVLHQ